MGPGNLNAKEFPGTIVHRMLLSRCTHTHEPMPDIITKTGKDIIPVIFICIRSLFQRIPELFNGFIKIVKLHLRPPEPDTSTVRGWNKSNHKYIYLMMSETLSFLQKYQSFPNSHDISGRQRCRCISTWPLLLNSTPSASNKGRCSLHPGAVRPSLFTTR